MTRDRPGAWARLRYVYGGRLPAWRDWVRRDLTDPGWRERVVLRVIAQVLPFVAIGVFVPGPSWLHEALPALILLSTLIIAAPFSEELRDARLRRHGLPVPGHRDEGPPPPGDWPGMRR
ncbi:MAG: hypothetical protein JWM93_159 [Frankiales bacterium]|nr:hypothetical protein [Frankiales bacterium]